MKHLEHLFYLCEAGARIMAVLVVVVLFTTWLMLECAVIPRVRANRGVLLVCLTRLSLVIVVSLR